VNHFVSSENRDAIPLCFDCNPSHIQLKLIAALGVANRQIYFLKEDEGYTRHDHSHKTDVLPLTNLTERWQETESSNLSVQH
jgi:hypothetical protein